MKSSLAASTTAGLFAIALVGCGSSAGTAGSEAGGPSSSTSTSIPGKTKIESALSECGISPADRNFDVGDGGYTLSIDGEGEEDSGAGITDIACVLFALDVSDAVVGRIDNTRALDGTQEGSWGDFYATWSYHPDSGMSMVIEDRS